MADKLKQGYAEGLGTSDHRPTPSMGWTLCDHQKWPRPSWHCMPRAASDDDQHQRMSLMTPHPRAHVSNLPSSGGHTTSFFFASSIFVHGPAKF